MAEVTNPSHPELRLRELDDVMDFEIVIRSHGDGKTVTDMSDQMHGPELFDGVVSEGWTLLKGFSGQHGYSGPLMHASEFIGGGMERWILENPGYYVALVNTPADDDEPTEWAVAYRAV